MKILLNIIVFVSGAIVMILELTGSRFIAPYLGTSIFVWTSLIGVILASLSLGYYWGGKLADQNPTTKKLSYILFLSALCIGIPSYLSFTLPIIASTGNIRLAAVISSFLLFGPATIALGMVSPYVGKLKIQNIESVGSSLGNLYALSTVGSIVGTFLGGFFLIPIIGATKLLLLLSFPLLALACITYIWSSRDKKLILPLAIFVTFFLFPLTFLASETLDNPDLVLEKDTRYSRIWIRDTIDGRDGGTIRSLTNSIYGTQSAMSMNDPNLLIAEYTKFFDIAFHFTPKIKNVLMFGGAAYSYPKSYLKNNQEGRMDVVEIDPEVTEIAKQYFTLKDDPRLSIYHEDARVFLNRNTKKYDAILIDAFSSYLSIPFQLTTKEAVQKVHDSLDEDGVTVVNIISAIDGLKGKFLRAEYKTYQSIFPHVYIFQVYPWNRKEDLQNIIMVALKSPLTPKLTSKNAKMEGFLSQIFTGTIENDMPILTDEFAPVESYTALFF